MTSHGFRLAAGRARLACGALLSLAACAAPPAAAQESPQIRAANEAFRRHLAELPAPQRAAADAVAATAANDGDKAESLIPDGLAVLYPEFRAAVAAFDDERYADAARMLEPLADKSRDPFLAANAGYYYARCLVERGLFEEGEKFTAVALAVDSAIETRTPYAAHLWLMRGFCQSRNLRYELASASLRNVIEKFPAAPEPVLAGARQLLLEIERREIGTLDEVSRLMSFAGGRLKVADAGAATRQRQDEAVALLDKLIDQAQQREKQQSQGGKSGKKGRAGRATPTNPAQQSEAPSGAGQIGDLHDPGKANPGEMWGKLPPADREKILQSLKARYPSRYRELVEQYYRSLAEEK